MEKTCLECGTVIYGRMDKRFCCGDCRNNYNNRENRTKYQALNRINSILRRNRGVLEKCYQGNFTKLTKGDLLFAGYNFGFSTGKELLDTGNYQIYCYEYVLTPQDIDEFKITKEEVLCL